MENNTYKMSSNYAHMSQHQTNVLSLLNQGSRWIVSIVDGITMPLQFLTVDTACDYMIDKLNISEDEIDLAVVHLHNNKHVRALFVDGKFERTAVE